MPKSRVAKSEDFWLWYKCLDHVHFDLLNRVMSKDVVVGLPKTKFLKEKLCDARQKGKQTRVCFKLKNVISTTRTLELLHLDLFGPLKTTPRRQLLRICHC